MKLAFAVLLALVSAASADGKAPRTDGWYAFTNAAIQQGATGAAILGKDGTFWASSGSLESWPASAAKDVPPILAGIKGDQGPLRATGLNINGTKFMPLQVTEDQITGKKGTSSVGIVPSQTAIVVIVLDSGSPPHALGMAAKIADAMSKQKF